MAIGMVSHYMDAIITMDRFGRLVLPRRIPKVLHISQKTTFRAEVMGNKVELTLMQPKRGAVLKRRRGLLVISTGGRKFNAIEAIGAVREVRA